MAPRVPRQQAFFFYDSNWNASVEKEFLLNLSQYALAANSTLECTDVAPIRHSIFSVNEKCGTSFSRKEAMRRFKHLKHRHEKFPIAEAYMTNGEAEWPEMRFIFGAPKTVDVFENHEVIEIFDDRSIPRPPEAYDPVPSIPTNIHHRESPSPIPSAFWNELPRIISRSDVVSQDSIQYPVPRTTTFTPNELIVGGCQDQTRSPTQRSHIRQNHASDPSTGEPGCSSHASSATPKKPDRHCH